jgi:hypothetical protein
MSAEKLHAEQLTSLPTIEPGIVGLSMGRVRRDHHDKPQVYLGGDGIEHLTPYNKLDVHDGAIHVDRYSVDGYTNVDYSEFTLKNRSSQCSPVHYFNSPGSSINIPIKGRARWLAQDPEGNFSEGIYDDNKPASYVAMISEGWTFCWIVQGGREFKFGELSSPSFLDQTASSSTANLGISEIELGSLSDHFKERFVYYMSGGQNSVTAS